MKRINTLFILVSILLIGFISCKKDSDTDNSNPNPNPSPATPSKYLSKISFYYDNGSGTENLKRNYSYVFDNLKRVTHVMDSFVNTSGTLVPHNVTEYFYQGNDSLPFKSVNITSTAIDTTTNYYTYNGSGLLVHDSGYFVTHGTGNSSVSYSQAYTYSGSTITGRKDRIVTNSSGSYAETWTDTAQTDAAGNLVANVKHKSPEIIHSTITWDNHPSPFAKLSNYRSSFIFPFGETFFYDLPQKNNRLHITEVTSGSGPSSTYDEDFTSSYTYNADGYPVQILYADPSVPGTHDKIVFEYITL